ncbi:MAG: electron transfer flavoprotein subunit beta/FixA family protein [Acidobacteriota bacterium]
MKIAVCIKQVPDTEARLRVAGHGRWLEEDDLKYRTNETDEQAITKALEIAEKHGGEVIALSLGPDRAKDSLRKALALDAVRAVHLVDEAFQDGDAAATGRALAAVLQKENVDLVLTGSQSDDVGYGATASMLAGELGWPHAWLAIGLEIEEGESSAKVTREMESGMNEIFRVSLPAVIEVQAGITHPRYPTLRGIMKAKRKPYDTPTPADLGLDPATVGLAGSRVEIVDVAFPDTGEGAEVLEGDAAVAAGALVEKLQRDARVL